MSVANDELPRRWRNTPCPSGSRAPPAPTSPTRPPDESRRVPRSLARPRRGPARQGPGGPLGAARGLRASRRAARGRPRGAPARAVRAREPVAARRQPVVLVAEVDRPRHRVRAGATIWGPGRALRPGPRARLVRRGLPGAVLQVRRRGVRGPGQAEVPGRSRGRPAARVRARRSPRRGRDPLGPQPDGTAPRFDPQVLELPGEPLDRRGRGLDRRGRGLGHQRAARVPRAAPPPKPPAATRPRRVRPGQVKATALRPEPPRARGQGAQTAPGSRAVLRRPRPAVMAGRRGGTAVAAKAGTGLPAPVPRARTAPVVATPDGRPASRRNAPPAREPWVRGRPAPRLVRGTQLPAPPVPPALATVGDLRHRRCRPRRYRQRWTEPCALTFGRCRRGSPTK